MAAPSSIPDRLARPHPVAFAVVLAAITVGVYAPVLNYPFIGFDDPSYVALNPHIASGLTWANIVWAFQTFEMGNWNPLTWISHMMVAQCFGLSAAAHHAANLLLHIFNVVLFFFLLRRATNAPWSSFFAAALFAIHPLHVESVAWVSDRKGVLSLFFTLLAFAAYGWYARRPELKRYLAVFALMAAALMSKPMAVTLPLLFLLADYWPLGRMAFAAGEPGIGTEASPVRSLRFLLLEKLPFAALSLIFSYVTVIAQRSADALNTSQPLASHIQNATLGYLFYLSKLLYPVDLSIYYPLPAHASWLGTVAGLALLAGITVVVVRLREHRFLLFGWLFFLVALLPVIGLVQVGAQLTADRYTYLPLLGLYAAVAGALSLLPERRVMVAVPAALVILLLLAADARYTLSYWRNGLLLFTRAERLAPAPSERIETVLGSLYQEAGLGDEALKHAQFAAELSPDTPGVDLALGIMLARNGQPEQAVPRIQKAVSLASSEQNRSDALHNLGAVQLMLGQYEDADRSFSRVLAYNPTRYAALIGRGRARYALHHYQAAENDFTTAIRLAPSFDAFYGLGQSLEAGGDVDKALTVYQYALQQAAAQAPGSAVEELRAHIASLSAQHPSGEGNVRQ